MARSRREVLASAASDRGDPRRSRGQAFAGGGTSDPGERTPVFVVRLRVRRREKSDAISCGRGREERLYMAMQWSTLFTQRKRRGEGEKPDLPRV